MLPLLVTNVSNNNLVHHAQALAQQWGFNYMQDIPLSTSFYLLLGPEHLQLVCTDKQYSPIFIDFASGAIDHRRKFGGGKGQTIAKAVGFNKIAQPLILDATAGMGKDAFVFASLGAQVILMERSPISAVLLSDALERARSHPDIKDIIQRMDFKFGDARTLTQAKVQKWGRQPDVVYLDPMFPHRKKTALVKKEMLVLQQLIGNDSDSGQLLEAGLEIAKRRVVVKRPIKAACLNNQAPTYSMKMKKHRFDVYII